MDSAAKKIVKQKLTPQEQEQQNRAGLQEAINDIGAPPEQLREKANAQELAGKVLEANLTRTQAGLNEATPAVAGIASKAQPIIGGVERLSKLDTIAQKSQPIIDELNKVRDQMKPEFYDSAINIVKRIAGGTAKPMDMQSIRNILNTYRGPK